MSATIADVHDCAANAYARVVKDRFGPPARATREIAVIAAHGR